MVYIRSQEHRKMNCKLRTNTRNNGNTIGFWKNEMNHFRSVPIDAFDDNYILNEDISWSFFFFIKEHAKITFNKKFAWLCDTKSGCKTSKPNPTNKKESTKRNRLFTSIANHFRWVFQRFYLFYFYRFSFRISISFSFLVQRCAILLLSTIHAVWKVFEAKKQNVLHAQISWIIR